MDISVILERVENNGYRARCAEPLAASAEGGTREEALGRLRGVLAEKLASGVEVVRLHVPVAPGKSPIWPDDDFTRLWLEGVTEARREAEENPLLWEQAEAGQP